jgi:uncharacterized protein
MPGSKTYMMLYSYVPDMMERRLPYREAHLLREQQACAEGKILLAGAFTDPNDGALIVFQADSPGEALEWAASDPYTIGGLMRAVSVREVNVAIALKELRPFLTMDPSVSDAPTGD